MPGEFIFERVEANSHKNVILKSHVLRAGLKTYDYKLFVMSKVVLISCASKKLSDKAPAKDLYISPWFKMNLSFARSLKPDKIYILSAKHGLLDLEKEIEPYDQTLNAMKSFEIKQWAEKVREQMKGKIDFENDEIVFLAGTKYRKYLLPFFRKVSIPLEGLGIGKQLQYLKNKISYAK